LNAGRACDKRAHFMGDSLPTFDDLQYTGLTDTADGFSGSSTLQDVQLGSPVLLDMTYGESNTATPDFITQPFDNFSAQSLSGISDPPFASAPQSSPTPTVTQPNADSWAGLTALSKFGAGVAGLFSAQPVHAGARPVVMSPAGGALLPGAASGTSTLLLLVVVGALVILLLRSE
jgi:hypothetical protein